VTTVVCLSGVVEGTVNFESAGYYGTAGRETWSVEKVYAIVQRSYRRRARTPRTAVVLRGTAEGQLLAYSVEKLEIASAEYFRRTLRQSKI
jgi:hypothetical protein